MKHTSRNLILIVLSFLLFLSALGASSWHTVPLDSRAYDIIAVAQDRGLIPPQSNVKPYSYNTVMTLLETIKGKTTRKAELREIEEVEASLRRSYEPVARTNLHDVLMNGNYATVDDSGNWSAQLGIRFQTIQTFGYNWGEDYFAYDTRNSIWGYIAGNLSRFLSYDMNIGLTVDQLDPSAYLFHDFTIECEGFYKSLFSGGGYTSELPFDGLKAGLVYSPEIDAGFFGGRLQMRFSSIRHDWGPGYGNIQLSSSARSFPAVEINADLASWLRFHSIVGSLSNYDGDTIYDDESSAYRQFLAEFGGDKKNYRYDNNFSAQRVEANFGPVKFGIFESVVWKKRMEFAYLNPIGIYMYDQNALGDLDNMIAGLDMEVFWHKARFWGVFAASELSDPKHIVTGARNITALQLGMEIPIPLFSFSKLTVQFTRLSPFFYSHYEDDDNPWDQPVNLAYVNKGFNLGYPLDPDSAELLIAYDAGFGHGLSLNTVFKSQFRSAQYSTTNYGTTVETFMDYSNDDEYSAKHFLDYIWNIASSLEVTVHKNFESYPLEIWGGLRFELDFRRSYDVDCTTVTESYQNIYDEYIVHRYNYGDGTTMHDDWSSAFGVYFTLGAKLWF